MPRGINAAGSSSDLPVGAVDGAAPVGGRDAPSDEQCERLLEALLSAPQPLTVTKLSTDVHMRPTTVRFHLAHLTDAGLVAGVSSRSASRGRPSVLYRATSNVFDSGPQHPQLLTEVLMHHFLAEPEVSSQSVEDPEHRPGRRASVWERARGAGRAWSARRLGLTPGKWSGRTRSTEDGLAGRGEGSGAPANANVAKEKSDIPTRGSVARDCVAQLDAFVEQLGEWGFAPSRTDMSDTRADSPSSQADVPAPRPVAPEEPDSSEELVRIGLNRCPFAHEAAECPDLVCGIHAGVIDGLLTRLGGEWRVAKLVPHASAAQCLLETERSRGPEQAAHPGATPRA